jgi:ubiquinol-cytochrome c reductase cytochrome c1 subunit
MKKIMAFLALILVALSAPGQASESAGLSPVELDVFDLAAVRRGATVYANYCSGCHSLSRIRYSRILKDLNLTETDMRNEFMLGDVRIHDTLKSALSPVDGESMFGVAPPDLSLIARSRGVDWVYAYLKGFYADPSRPLGVNNIVAENIAMPNVFWGLQGIQEPIRSQVHGESVVTGLKLVKPGSQTVTAFDQTVRDLLTFLAYVAEPAQLQRLPLGKYVLFVLLVLTVVFYRLKKEYWKELH